MDPERARQLLEERARALARPVVRPAAGELLELVTFALADEIYALESRHVLAVFRLADLSPLPGAEPPVAGVTVWRGDLLTILDLRRVLGLSVAALDDLTRVIVLGGERPAFGILADTVRELVVLPSAAVLEPATGAAAPEYLRGITSDGVLVLDASKLLHLHE